jgi:hypothetical protein
MFKGILFIFEFEQSTKNPNRSQLHSSGQCIASVVVWIINHNQNITTGVANSNDTNITVSLDDKANFLDLHRERN